MIDNTAHARIRPHWTIHICGAPRHDGDKPCTYVVEADSIIQAKRQAWLYHVWSECSGFGTHSGDHLDVVVIDCLEFRCHLGMPFACWDPVHYEPDSPGSGQYCTCQFPWLWVDWCPGVSPPVDEQRLHGLGYPLPNPPPEENQW